MHETAFGLWAIPGLRNVQYLAGMAGLRILIVEDQFIEASDLRQILERAGHIVCGVAASVKEALAGTRNTRPDFVLVDIFLKGEGTGIDLAYQLHQDNIPFIFISANSTEATLAAAKPTHPYGFLVKPFRDRDILAALDIAVYRHTHDLAIRSRRPAPKADAPFTHIVGRSPGLRFVLEQVEQVAPFDTSVLIIGETGTGKEGLVTAIHALSPRRDKPLIRVNCGAIPSTLIESELFGHEKGSFTDATERRLGKFELAQGGTIFLDEIGEIPPEIQVKLLRVLQEKEIERIGGERSIYTDVRVIAATNKDLEKEMAAGNFRLDLYYRIHVFPISLPALRERSDDIPLLVEHFLERFTTEFGFGPRSVSAAALQQLKDYSWPGNIRELEHLMERHVLTVKTPVIEEFAMPGRPVFREDDPVKTVDDAERDHILSVLRRCNGRISGRGGAAEMLRIPPTTLSYRIKKLGIVWQHS